MVILWGYNVNTPPRPALPVGCKAGTAKDPVIIGVTPITVDSISVQQLAFFET